MEISQLTITWRVKKLGFTLKNLTIIPEGRNANTTLEKRREYIQKIQDKNINIFNDIMYIDEWESNLHITCS